MPLAFNEACTNLSMPSDDSIFERIWMFFTIKDHTCHSSLLVSSSGLAVKHPALGANGHRFDPSNEVETFQRLISRLTTSWVVTTLNGAAFSTDLIKMGTLKTSWGRKTLWQWPPSGYFGSVLLSCEWWGKCFSQPLQHRQQSSI